MRISIEDLRAFVLVAEIRNFHRAAEELAITQSALSRRLKKMEDVLQTRLLDRTSRVVGLTTVGEEFLPTAMRMVREFERSMGDIQDIIEKRAGVVTMASVLTIAQNVLPQVVSHFNEQFPSVSVRVMDDVGPKVADLVATGDAEFGIALAAEDRPNLEYQPIIEDPYMLACREDHPLAAKAHVTWGDLREHIYIRMGAEAGNQRKLESALGDNGALPVGTHEVAHISTLLSFVGAGLGVSAVPKLATVQRPDLNLVFRPLADPVVSRTIGLIKPVGRTLSPSALALSDIAGEVLRQAAAGEH
ncbi:MAG: LysR family transcriptional regulator [Alphaproteobacteria bacterium]|nr:LysR family transcriptional regulator [Alphaproteobacteria bacterium]